MDEMLAERRWANKQRRVVAASMSSDFDISRGDAIARIMCGMSREWWIAERVWALMHQTSPLSWGEAARRAPLDFEEYRKRRDPFAEFGIYSGLTEPMKPRPW